MSFDPDAIRQIDPQGIRALGAKIIGILNLSQVQVPFAITLRNCAIAEAMNLDSAEIGNLDLSGSYTGPIHAKSIDVGDTLRLADGFHALGQVNLLGAKIGTFLATNGHFKDSPGEDDLPGAEIALFLAEAQIKGSVWMDRGFESDGTVLLTAATISGDLLCISGRFIHPGNLALEASFANIGGTVYLNGALPFPGPTHEPFLADGLVDFPWARVGAMVVVDGARIRVRPPRQQALSGMADSKASG